MENTILTSQGEIRIRPCGTDDAAVYKELRLEALRGNPTEFGADYEETLLHPEAYWERRVNYNPEDEIIYLAEKDGKARGMTGIYRGSGRKARHSATVWGVYVSPELRGAHIAEELIKACLEWGRERGVVVARLGVGTRNASAIRCYERCGFVPYGIELKSGYYKGEYFDECLMAISLE